MRAAWPVLDVRCMDVRDPSIEISQCVRCASKQFIAIEYCGCTFGYVWIEITQATHHRGPTHDAATMKKQPPLASIPPLTVGGGGRGRVLDQTA